MQSSLESPPSVSYLPCPALQHILLALSLFLFLWLLNSYPPAMYYLKRRSILIHSQILWVRSQDRAQWGQLMSAPCCLGPQLGDFRAGGWGHLEMSSLTRLVCGWDDTKVRPLTRAHVWPLHVAQLPYSPVALERSDFLHGHMRLQVQCCHEQGSRCIVF